MKLQFSAMHRTLFFIFFSLCIATNQAADAQTYTTVYLPSPTSNNVSVTGISDGMVAGSNNVGAGLLWNGTTNGIILLGASPYPSALENMHPYGINGWNICGMPNSFVAAFWNGATQSVVNLNESPLVTSYCIGLSPTAQVGWGLTSYDSTINHAYIWYGTAASGIDINPSGYTSSTAIAVDGSHEVGYGLTSDNVNHPLLWTGSSNNVVDLTPTDLPGYTNGQAIALDDSMNLQGGGVWGPSGTDLNFNALTIACLWNGTAESAVSLAPPGSVDSAIYAMAGGQEAGFVNFGPAYHAYVWNGSNPIGIDLTPNLPAGYQAQASSIDSNGDVAGTIFQNNSFGVPLSSIPVIWERNDVPHINVSQNPLSNSQGWNTGPVDLTVTTPFTNPASTITYQNGSSAPVTLPGSSADVIVNTDGYNELTFTASDGTTVTLPHNCLIPLDSTPPTSKSSLTGTLVAPGIYSSAVGVTLSATDALSGVANTQYTLDGGATSTYSSMFTVSGNGNHTITFWSTDIAGNIEPTNTVTFAIAPQVPTPTISPASGTYVGSTSLSFADTLAGATIKWTSDGSNPATNPAAHVYTSPLTLSRSATITAAAVKSGYTNSAIASSTYTITAGTQVPTPTISPVSGTYIGSAQIMITDSLASTVIKYTTDGSNPATSATALTYSGQFTLSSSATVTAIATKTGYVNSVLAANTYTITPIAPTPVITPGSGSFTSPVPVTITDSLGTATIMYTTDGTDPATSPTAVVYSGQFTLNASATVTAVAIASGYANSSESSASYTISIGQIVPAPVLTPGSGTYIGSVTVMFSDSLAGTTMKWTSDGSNPATSSTARTYGGALTLNRSAKLSVVGIKAGYTNSQLVVGTYTIK